MTQTHTRAMYRIQVARTHINTQTHPLACQLRWPARGSAARLCYGSSSEWAAATEFSLLAAMPASDGATDELYDERTAEQGASVRLSVKRGYFVPTVCLCVCQTNSSYASEPMRNARSLISSTTMAAEAGTGESE